MAEQKARHFVILGGGTAGWLAALHLASFGNISVVHSDRIGPIGVGEGSTGLLTATLQKFGLHNTDFFKTARATLKLGIFHRGWGRSGADYWGPIDRPPGDGPDGFPLLQAAALAAGRPVSDAHCNGWLMARQRVSVVAAEGNGVELLPLHALHFDAGGFAAYLRQVCLNRGVREIRGEVTEPCEMDEGGLLTALRLADGRRISGDFFIDCSGFARRLIEGALGGRFQSWHSVLPVDRALTVQRPHPPEQDIPGWTLAEAMGAGWLWGIPTQDRMGYGAIFAADFQDADRAGEELERRLGLPLKDTRLLRFEAGRMEKNWIANCVAIGLAAGFAEPLEATSIHATLIQLQRLCEILALAGRALPDRRIIAGYNQAVAAMQDEFRDFLILHYRGGRRDTPFWRAVSDMPLPDRLAARLDRWRTHFPVMADFADGSGGVSPTLYLPVLAGLGIIGSRQARHTLQQYALTTRARDAWKKTRGLYSDVCAAAYRHRQALEYLSPQSIPQEIAI